MKNINDLKDKLLLFGWITGLLIIISVIWNLSQPVQAYYLQRTVNNIFINNDDPRRLSSYLPKKHKDAFLLGYWFLMHNSEDIMFVFSIFQDGILIPLGAIVSDEGVIKEIIPLSAHAVKVFGNLHQNIIQMYAKRIEEASG